VVTLCTFPSVVWVKYEVLLYIIIYVIFGTVIYMFFTYLCFSVLFSSLILLFLACMFVCLLFLCCLSVLCCYLLSIINSLVLVCVRTIQIERSPLVGEVSANVCTWRQRNGPPRPYSRFSRPEPLLFLPCSSSIVLTRLSGPVPDLLLLRKSGSAENRTRDLWFCSQEL
jgi:hypothetical protein